MKKLAWIIGVPIALFLLIVIIKPATNPEVVKLRDGLDRCWKDQAKKSLTPADARIIASVCEGIENELKTKYGVNP
jgi:hypothetical protein